jgi:hypothetical protein
VGVTSFRGGVSSAFPLEGGRWGWGLRLEMKRSTPYLAFPLPGGRDGIASTGRLQVCAQIDRRKRSLQTMEILDFRPVVMPLPWSTTHSFSRGPTNKGGLQALRGP